MMKEKHGAQEAEEFSLIKSDAIAHASDLDDSIKRLRGCDRLLQELQIP